MPTAAIPTEFFNLLPLPVLINKPQHEDLNSPIVFLNTHFLTEIGWTLEDIPDKDSWWQKAYAEPAYRKVVKRQWELGVSNALDTNESFLFIDANISTKFSGVRRYKIYTQVNSHMLPGYNVVAFGNCEASNW